MLETFTLARFVDNTETQHDPEKVGCVYVTNDSRDIFFSSKAGWAWIEENERPALREVILQRKRQQLPLSDIHITVIVPDDPSESGDVRIRVHSWSVVTRTRPKPAVVSAYLSNPLYGIF